MITFQALSGPGLRILGGARAVCAYNPKAAEAKDLVLLSKPEENPKNDVLSWPGEYDRSGIAVKGIGQEEGQHVSFVCMIDDTRVAVVAAPVLDWSEKEIEKLGEVAVLVVPAQDAKKVQALVDEVDPRVLILVAGEGGKMENDVLKAVGALGKEQTDEYKLKGLPAEGREVVILAK